MNGPELFEFYDLVSVVEMAKEAGLQVAAHVFTEDGIRDCINAGVNTVEHAVPFNRTLEKTAREKGIFFTPTFYCSWKSLRNEYISTIFEVELIYLKQWNNFLVDNFNKYVESRLPTLAGSDAGSSPCSFNDTAYEIVMLHKQGLPILESLQSGTIEAARALQRETAYGSIEIGKYANILLVNENPLKNLETLLDVQTI